jgi:muramoyltetrapeptide carboxypeptidase LdcA involved in peptidoglycan recycling
MEPIITTTTTKFNVALSKSKATRFKPAIEHKERRLEDIPNAFPNSKESIIMPIKNRKYTTAMFEK